VSWITTTGSGPGSGNSFYNVTANTTSDAANRDHLDRRQDRDDHAARLHDEAGPAANVRVIR
jgi:hypothetical protein